MVMRDSGFNSGLDPEREPVPPADPVNVGRNILIKQLTAGPRTRLQLETAMRKRLVPQDVIDSLLDRFEELGLVNDAAFADAWVRSRHESRGLAPRALARELQVKGVAPELIAEAVETLDADQQEARARELVEKKLASVAGLRRDQQVRRLTGMLARRGYSPSLCMKVVKDALQFGGADGPDVP